MDSNTDIADSRRILIVEDDPSVLGLLESIVHHGGYASARATTAKEALEIFNGEDFDAILLDLSLPDLDGSELIRSIRARSDVPILVISGQLGEQRRVASLDLGADDFIPKPFLPGELLARVRAAVRRADRETAHREIAFDPDQPFIEVRGRRVPLSTLEHKMLAVLARSAGGSATKQELCEALWGGYSTATGKSLYVMANRLRNKIEADPGQPVHIISQHGLGYRLRK